jgi:Ca2+-binding EF-hand superfamily protein
MRAILVTSLFLVMAGCTSNPEPTFRRGPPPGAGDAGEDRGPGPRGQLFISPMGQPFRGERGSGDPQDVWFDNADTNHDGGLSRAEFATDAARFFKILDRGHDGEIDPDDITYYETVLAPEIRVGGGGAARIAKRVGLPGGGHRGGGGPGGGGHGNGGRHGGGESGGGQGGETRVTYDKQGASRFSYFDFPEPVTVADSNFNRGVDPGEFEHAADTRFALLDRNGDGRIDRRELPRISATPAGARGPRGRVPLGKDAATVEGAGETP